MQDEKDKTMKDTEEISSRIEALMTSILTGESRESMKVFSFAYDQIYMFVTIEPTYLLAATKKAMLICAPDEAMRAMQEKGLAIVEIDTLNNFSGEEAALWAVCNPANIV